MTSAEDDVFLFAKTSTLHVDAENPGILSVRPSESLEIVQCSGKGRLLLSVSDASSQQVVVEDAICYDSDAYFFSEDESVRLDHVVIKDAATCTLVEIHVEHTEQIVVEIKQTYRFADSERRQGSS